MEIVIGTLSPFWIKHDIKPHLVELLNKMETRPLYGTINPSNGFDISLSDVSHSIKNIIIHQDEVEVILEIFMTLPYGSLIVDALNNNVQLDIVPRVSGILNYDGSIIIKKVFTFDITT